MSYKSIIALMIYTLYYDICRVREVGQ